MRKYLFIGCGGFFGAVLRYLIKGIQIYHYHENIPLNTLVINVSGTFIMALILTIAFEIRPIDDDIRLGLTTGFLGAFTTFSTLCKETVGLINNGGYLSAISYLTLSTLLGFAAAYLGIAIARETGSRLLRKKEDNDRVIERERDVD